MKKDPYSILGVSKNASDEEIKRAYHDLARKYHPDNYGDDNPLKDLAEDKMQEINAAYEEINRQRGRSRSKNSGSSGGANPDTDYFNIRMMIENRRFKEAEVALASIPINDRGAEWHYLTSVLLMHNGRINDAMRELEIACTMDPGNEEYQKAKEMFNSTANNFSGQNPYGNPYGSGAYYTSAPRRSAADDACNCCTNLICLDCLCECLGGDLLRCI